MQYNPLMLLAAAALACVSGCVSLDPSSFTYVDVKDKSQVFFPPDTTGAFATITARREPAFGGSAATVFFTLEGRPIVRLGQGEQFSFRVGVGQHVVGSRCESLLTRANEVGITAEAVRNYVFRIYSNQGDTCLVAPMSSTS